MWVQVVHWHQRLHQIGWTVWVQVVHWHQCRLTRTYLEIQENFSSPVSPFRPLLSPPSEDSNDALGYGRLARTAATLCTPVDTLQPITRLQANFGISSPHQQAQIQCHRTRARSNDGRVHKIIKLKLSPCTNLVYSFKYIQLVYCPH